MVNNPRSAFRQITWVGRARRLPISSRTSARRSATTGRRAPRCARPPTASYRGWTCAGRGGTAYPDRGPERLTGPLDRAEGEELRERVRASVDRLPDFLRQVLVLAYYQGLKYREIAGILGIPVGTVKSRLHAALVKLQEAWSSSPSLYEA